MIAVIIILVIAVVGYFIYQILPSTKFEKASNLFSAGNLNEAINILDEIFDKHPEAPAKLAECRLMQGQNVKTNNEIEAIKFFNQAIEIKNRLPSSANKAKFELIEAKAFYEIAKNNFSNATSGNNADSKAKRLKENLRFIDTATQAGIKNNFTTLRKKHLSELSSIYFLFGTQNEKSGKLIDAIQNYSISKDFSVQSSNSEVQNNSLIRIGICKFKNREQLEAEIINEINKVAPDNQLLKECKNDFYYRYSVWQLKNKNYSEAEKLISSQLNVSSKAVDKLKQIIKNEKIKNATEKLNQINRSLETLFENKFPIVETKELYDSLDKTIDEVKTIIPSLTNKLQELKPSLFNKLLSHYILAGQYANAINLIQKFPTFWESPELLKDLGICCYGFTANGNITEKNYRVVISNWLTSVFSDKVIIKSLETTTWDDDYTFTLAEAIGSSYSQHQELPDNVNHNDASDTNISIGSAQMELLNQYETLLHQKISDSSLIKSVADFYEAEKQAIQRIVSVISSDILFASPHFAKAYGMNEEIIKELDNDYLEYSNEESLEAGIPYLKSNSDTYVSEYATAKETVTKLVTAIQNEKLSELKTIAADRKKSLIEKYATINGTVEDSAFNIFNLKIDEDGKNEKLIPLMEECIRFISKNDKLKFQYANYITSYCIAKVNEDEMGNFKALDLMKNAYLHSTDNPRICKNIITLIRFNLMDILNDRTKNTNNIYKILDEIIPNQSIIFKQNANELAKARKDILDQLKKAGVDISLLVEQTSFLSITSFQTGRTLTTEGERMKKVLQYFKKLSESGNDEILDPLAWLKKQ